MGDLRDDLGDESYFERSERETEGFDAGLLREPLGVIPAQKPVLLKPAHTVPDALSAMQRDHRGCVLVTDDGTKDSKLLGIFTERDELFRIVDKGRNPAALPVGEVMLTTGAFGVRATWSSKSSPWYSSIVVTPSGSGTS